MREDLIGEKLPGPVLIVRSAYGELYEPAWNRALNEIGVRTTVFDAHECLSPGIIGRLEEHFLRGPGILLANERLIRQVKKERPQIVLLYHGHHFTAATIRELRRWAFVTGCHCDDPFGRRSRREYRLLLKALPFYDAYHVNRPCNVSEARELGISKVKVLRQYYIPWLHFPETLNADEQAKWSSDLVFAGHAEPDLRTECFTRAVRSGVRTRLFGGERFWREALPSDVFDRVRPIAWIPAADCRKALCGSKVGACFASKRNRDECTHRSWEIPACGVFMLAERSAAMQEFYVEGDEAEFFDSADEFIDKLTFYLSNDSARMRIANRGLKRVNASGHDIYSRMKQWCRDINEWTKD